MKVMIVDDDPAFVMALREMLERAGHSVEVSWDGSEAVLAVRENPAEVVILDYRMPGFDGDATAKLLRKLAPGIRIIGVSAAADIDEDWADEFVPKHEVIDRIIPLVEARD